MSVAHESQSVPLVRDIESLKFKSNYQWKLSLDTCNLFFSFSIRACITSAWVGGKHLSGAAQEMCIPAHVSQSLIWLAQQCAQFRASPLRFLQPARFCSHLVKAFRCQSFLFQNVPPAEERPSVSFAGGPSPMQVSHPFVTVSDVTEGVQCATPAPQRLNHILNFPKGGPIRLTRFVEIPLDLTMRACKR